MYIKIKILIKKETIYITKIENNDITINVKFNLYLIFIINFIKFFIKTFKIIYIVGELYYTSVPIIISQL